MRYRSLAVEVDPFCSTRRISSKQLPECSVCRGRDEDMIEEKVELSPPASITKSRVITKRRQRSTGTSRLLIKTPIISGLGDSEIVLPRGGGPPRKSTRAALDTTGCWAAAGSKESQGRNRIAKACRGPDTRCKRLKRSPKIARGCESTLPAWLGQQDSGTAGAASKRGRSDGDREITNANKSPPCLIPFRNCNSITRRWFQASKTRNQASFQHIKGIVRLILAARRRQQVAIWGRAGGTATRQPVAGSSERASTNEDLR
ncbi:hypothetical protein B0H13DRAFT_1889226 [Mycena leptocephala]|nr:hypothetical protein B0H13DRAFT_1889226 [Mycena leptocephala]